MLKTIATSASWQERQVFVWMLYSLLLETVCSGKDCSSFKLVCSLENEINKIGTDPVVNVRITLAESLN